VRVLQTVPLLRIFDVGKARAFDLGTSAVVDRFGSRLRVNEDLPPAPEITPA
jgi:hypothetical protein